MGQNRVNREQLFNALNNDQDLTLAVEGLFRTVNGTDQSQGLESKIAQLEARVAALEAAL